MSSPSRARLTQARSRERRERLLDAAIELYAEGGARAVTHRSVAKRAGLPAATTTYYFTSVGELVRAALSRHTQTWIEDMQALAEVPLGLRIQLDEARDLVSMAFGVRSVETVRTQLTVFLAISGDPELRPLAADAARAMEHLAGVLLASVGIEDAEQLAEELTQLVVGSAAMRLSGAHDDERAADVLFDAVRRLVATWTMDPDVITAALPGPPA